ncbi:hypothetical protein CALVIDRAFT_280327 [Calocera viscosa TUFC12733]|uniref:Uncharacterized protein n=1 Tax=Calocera viscosa (strain TUFC12733) TaxID=1330018 RepID=A0A167R5K5_CALVF|nr:hypothetical protein CALVIDRAFT_280327 [Calocera viscosa TUFC12733]
MISIASEHFSLASPKQALSRGTVLPAPCSSRIAHTACLLRPDARTLFVRTKGGCAIPAGKDPRCAPRVPRAQAARTPAGTRLSGAQIPPAHPCGIRVHPLRRARDLRPCSRRRAGPWVWDTTAPPRHHLAGRSQLDPARWSFAPSGTWAPIRKSTLRHRWRVCEERHSIIRNAQLLCPRLPTEGRRRFGRLYSASGVRHPTTQGPMSIQTMSKKRLAAHIARLAARGASGPLPRSLPPVPARRPPVRPTPAPSPA